MKKTITALTLFAALTLMFSACKKEETSSFGTLTGIVIDSQTGEPIQRAMVTLAPTSKNTFTGSDGRFEFQNLEPMQYKVYVTKEGYETNYVNPVVYAGETTHCDMVLRPVQQ